MASALRCATPVAHASTAACALSTATHVISRASLRASASASASASEDEDEPRSDASSRLENEEALAVRVVAEGNAKREAADVAEDDGDDDDDDDDEREASRSTAHSLAI